MDPGLPVLQAGILSILERFMIRSLLITILVSVLLVQKGMAQVIIPDEYESIEQYMQLREQLITIDQDNRTFEYTNDIERRADSVFQSLKSPYLTLPENAFPPAMLFDYAREYYDSSPLLEIIDRMPKGGLLHVHPSATGSFEILIEATYDSSVWIYMGEDEENLPHYSLGWFEEQPDREWERTIDQRQLSYDAACYDRFLLENITIGREDYHQVDIWNEFENCFFKKWRLQANHELYWAYMENMIDELVEQNVQFVEMRTFIGPRRRPDGSYGTCRETVEEWVDLRDRIQERYPDFTFTIIASQSRWSSQEDVLSNFEEILSIQNTFPDLIVGFDLVSEEDKAKTNLEFLQVLLECKNFAENNNVPFTPYFHSGESNRMNNENLYDAILLGSRRIGHGFAITRHPVLMDLVIDRDICLEVCPLSNQTLGYVRDLRNHSAVDMLVRGVPFVISADDPGMMRYRWSYDWIAAAIAWDLSIPELKMLIENSFEYSTLTDEVRNRLHDVWETRWNEFVVWLSDLEINPQDVNELIEEGRIIEGY